MNTKLLPQETIERLLAAATPGPWQSPAKESPEQSVYACGYRIARLTGGSLGRDSANAALISAAPDLARTCLALYAQLADKVPPAPAPAPLESDLEQEIISLDQDVEREFFIYSSAGTADAIRAYLGKEPRWTDLSSHHNYRVSYEAATKNLEKTQ